MEPASGIQNILNGKNRGIGIILALNLGYWFTEIGILGYIRDWQINEINRLITLMGLIMD